MTAFVGRVGGTARGDRGQGFETDSLTSQPSNFPWTSVWLQAQACQVVRAVRPFGADYSLGERGEQVLAVVAAVDVAKPNERYESRLSDRRSEISELIAIGDSVEKTNGMVAASRWVTPRDDQPCALAERRR